jgi:hypothetical protein
VEFFYISSNTINTIEKGFLILFLGLIAQFISILNYLKRKINIDRAIAGGYDHRVPEAL